MVRSCDVMRLLDNCARMKISALLLDSHLCLVKKLTSLLTHYRGAPEQRISARELLDKLDQTDPACVEYFMV
jgi:hypothetical protein